MSDGVRESRLFAVKDVLGEVIALKSAAQEIFSLVISVELQGGIDRHHVLHEVEVAEGHARFEGIHADATVGAENVVQIELAHALHGFLLEGFRRGGEIGVFIAEELVADLAGEEHADVGLFVDRLADEIHPDARADGRDVEGAKEVDDGLERRENVLFGNDDFGVIAADIVRDLAGVFEVDGVDVHPDREGFDGLRGELLRDGADQRRVQAARKEEADGGVRIQPFLDPFDEFFADISAYLVQIRADDLFHFRDVRIGDESAIFIIITRGEGQDLIHEPDEVFRFACEGDLAALLIAVEEGTDADGVACRDEILGLVVIDQKGVFRVEHREHIRAVLRVKGEQDLGIAVAREDIALFDERLFQGAEAIDFTVTDHLFASEGERLHPFRMKPHDGKAVEADDAAFHFFDFGHVGTAALRSLKKLLKFIKGQ